MSVAIDKIDDADQVVELSRHLLILWDADDGAELEYCNSDDSDLTKDKAWDAKRQFSEWRDAVEDIVSFSEASSLDGALVQLALAVDSLNDINDLVVDEPKGFASKRLQIVRLVRSAMRAVRKDRTIHPTIQAFVEIYSGENSLWIDHVEALATEGRMRRERGD